MKKFLTLLLLAVSVMSSYAYDVCIDGIYYNLVPKAKQAQVTHNGGGSYTGDIVIPEKITSDGVEYSVTVIAENAFYYCSSLTSIQIPNSVTSIGNHAFNSCEYLTSIQIPNSVTSIGDYAFQFCSSLTSIQIPNSVTSIGSYAFERCSFLTSIEIPNSVTSIGSSAFGGCSSLTSIEIPNSVKSIGSSAFSGCSSLTSIQISNSVTSIEYGAFSGCTSLTSIEIPNSVTSIGVYAFQNCTSLTSIQIPNSVISIGSQAFRKCEKLTDIVLGSGIQNIYDQAFANCPDLENVYCNAANPPYTYSDAFEGSYIEYANLYVPTESLSSYRNTAPWSSFGNILALTPTDPEDIDFVDGEEYTNNIEKPCNTLTYTRNFTNTAWQSMYIPFSIPVSVLEEKGLEVAEIYNVHQYDRDEDGVYEETNIDFLKMKSGATLANYPYMVRAKEAGDVTVVLNDIEVAGAESVTIDCSTVKQLFTFTGTYDGVSGSVMYNNNYYAMNGNGGLQRAANSSVSLKPQRWYLAITNRDGSPVDYYAPNVRITVDGIEEEGFETSIEGINAQPEAESVYTLNGQIVNGEALAPGIYVKGGKKIIVK